MQLIRSLHFGWHIHFINPTMRPFSEILDLPYFIDQTSLTPQQMQASLDHDSEKLSEVIGILVGGAPVSPSLEERIAEFETATGTAVWETYGMTETASHIALRRIGTHPYFLPLEGVELYEENDLLSIHIPALSYTVATRDMVTIHPTGFEIKGRADHVINSGGVKIHPNKIEPLIANELEAAGIQRPFYLTRQADSTLGEKAVLVITGPPLKDEAHILEILKRALPQHTAPKAMHYVSEIDYTPSGKIIRAQISID